jgi:nucleoside-diphosphate-sugar epimerase
MTSPLIAVTGVSGFVGSHTAAYLRDSGLRVVGIARERSSPDDRQVGDINETTDWSTVLSGVDAVVHVAGLAHRLIPSSRTNHDLLRVNAAGTERLAQQAADLGVARLVFVSTIGVLGRNTNNREPFTNSDPAAPHDAYSVSKYEGEQRLLDVARRTKLEAVVIRPPMVYGRGAPANFSRIVTAVQRGFPLPIGAFSHNRRSFISVRNLASAFHAALQSKDADGQTLVVADDVPISTLEFVRRIAAALKRRPRIVSVPESLMRMASKLVGRDRDVERLADSLEIDAASTKQLLRWTPAQTIDQGLREAVGSHLG